MKVKEKLRNFASQLAEGAGTFLMWALYFVVGLVMAVPYTFLAGWNADALAISAMLLPIAAIVAYTLYTACKMRLHTIRWIHRVFWGFLGYCLLPIFANGISLVLKRAGLTAIGDFIFEYRYESLIVVPIISIIGLVAYSFAKSVWRQRFSGNATPPSSTPPNYGFG